jgi:SAM-dependent methyltransferase
MTREERPDQPPGRDAQRARVWLQETIARAYRSRPPYPAAVPDVLLSLLGDEESAAVLDVGCGTGDLARALVGEASRVDAVDLSPAMIAEGRRQEHGGHPRLRWICARVEEAELEPPYALAVAGDSLDWTDWYVTLPRLHDALTAEGLLAIVQRQWGTGAPEEGEIIRRYSTNPEYRPYDLVPELVARGLFRVENYLRVAGTWHPTIEEYVESQHARASFSREDMAADGASAFDGELADLLRRMVTEGRLRMDGARLRLPVRTWIAWGRPQPARAEPEVS